MATLLEVEKVNQSLLDHIILGVAHEINNPNAFVRMNMVNLKKMMNLLRPCLEEYETNHPDQKMGPYTLAELRSKIFQILESTLGATVRIIAVADKLKQCTSFALTQSTPISLLDLVNRVLEMHRFLLERHAKVDVVTEPGADYTVNCHQLQLEQAFSVLLTNACDAIAERYKESEDDVKGRIKIIFKAEEGFVSVSFADNGSGIEPEIVSKIFTPYFTTKPQGVGDGMGLPLCQAVVERHNGKIDVKSQKNEGTEFTVTLAKML